MILKDVIINYTATMHSELKTCLTKQIQILGFKSCYTTYS